MACITEREIELFSKRHELIDALSEERGSTPEEERRIAQQERDSKTTKLYRLVAETREIAAFLREDKAAAMIFEGAAQLYDRLATDIANEEQE